MIHFVEIGNGIPVVWIHGFPLSGQIFSPQMSIPGVRHVAPDLPGFGATPPAPEVSMDVYAREVLAVIDYLRIERAVFAGLSMGGYILLALARAAAHRIAGALFIDTRELADTEEGRTGRATMIQNVEKHGISAVIDAMLPKMLTPAGQGHADFVREVMESASVPGTVGALRAMAQRQDSTETLGALRAPTLILVGDSDTITPPADAQRMAGLVSGSELVVLPEAAHLSNIEQADLFNKAVESFLRRRLAGSLH